MLRGSWATPGPALDPSSSISSVIVALSGCPQNLLFSRSPAQPSFYPPDPQTGKRSEPHSCSGNVGKGLSEGKRQPMVGAAQKENKADDGLLFLKPVRRLENALGLNIYFAKNPRNHGKLQLNQHLIFILAHFLFKLLSSSSKTGEEAAPWGCVAGGCASLRILLGRLGADPSQLLAHRTWLGLALAHVPALDSSSKSWHLEGSQWLPPRRPILGPW